MKLFGWLLVVSMPAFLSFCSIKLNSHDNEQHDFTTSHAVVKYAGHTDKFAALQFVELKASDIGNIAAKNKHTIFYMLAPWCSPCVKKFEESYPQLDSLSIINNTPLIVFNNSYGFGRWIERIYKRVNLQSPIYVLDKDLYNRDIDVNTTGFIKEICDTCEANSNGMIFVLNQAGQMIYFKNDLSDANMLFTEIKKVLQLF